MNQNPVHQTPHTLLPDDDLSETQIYVTTQTYDRSAKAYADKWEWNPVTMREVKKYNITPFKKYVHPGGTVLIVECQSGRDYQLLTEEKFRCLGIGFSYGLLQEALKRVPNGIFIHLDVRSLPFMPESFDAIYADALVHTPKRDMASMLKDFRIFLKTRGVLYLSLKLGTYNVLVVEDLDGKRYMTLYRKEEICTMIENAGFSILWSEVSENTDPSLPKWFSLVAQKT